ncbi:MAG: thiol oxidoreductase [Chitinophagaceae bacterium]|nr:thiol oxidoreductase [Chitinophagaceae bacterium]
MNKMVRIVVAMVVIVSMAAIACQKLLPKVPASDQVLDGPIDGLSATEHTQFIQGDIAFNDEIFTPQTGLGPLFVATSCGSCHAGDGKGHPFSTLTRFGQTDSTGNKFLSLGGPQLQHRAVVNYLPETLPAGTTFSKFTPPANTGLGLLDAVSDADILSLADPDDNNGDGISGRPNWINIPGYLNYRPDNIKHNGLHIGRFGKKAAAYDLLHQTVNAYNQDMGISSSYEPYDTYSHAEVDPEISNQTVLNVVAYLKMLKAPVPRNTNDPEIIEGKNLFIQVACSKCHIPELKSSFSPINALSNKTFFPYTDLLLHDMGEQLNDGYTEGRAMPAEWRTPPLWGLGLSKKSQGGKYFLLHDGRANSIEEAISYHGGEATNSKQQFEQLSPAEKNKLIKFLESL